MEINETLLKEEVSSFVSSLQKLLPKKKSIITVVAPRKSNLRRLTDVHIEAKSVFPKCFIGAKLVVLREIMNKVKLVQQYNYYNSNTSKETYRSFPNLINNEMEPIRADDGLVIDTTGCATATYTENVEGSYEVRLTSKIKDLISSETELVLEKETNRSVGSLSFCMKDVDPSTLKFVTQWMQVVQPDFSVGTELTLRPLAYPSKPEVAISARYERRSLIVSSTISRAGFQFCLHKQFAPDMRISTIIHESNRGSPATIAIALHKNYQNGSELKIFVDSDKCGGLTFQKDVLFVEHHEQRVIHLVTSALLDRQRRVRFGFGFNLDF